MCSKTSEENWLLLRVGAGWAAIAGESLNESQVPLGSGNEKYAEIRFRNDRTGARKPTTGESATELREVMYREVCWRGNMGERLVYTAKKVSCGQSN